MRQECQSQCDKTSAQPIVYSKYHLRSKVVFADTAFDSHSYAGIIYHPILTVVSGSSLRNCYILPNINVSSTYVSVKTLLTLPFLLSLCIKFRCRKRTPPYPESQEMWTGYAKTDRTSMYIVPFTSSFICRRYQRSWAIDTQISYDS